VLACEHPNILPVERILDPDETRQCPYFVYRSTRGVKAKKVFLHLSLLFWQALVIALVCFGLIYLGLGKYLKGKSGDAILEANLEEPGTVMLDETFDLVARVENKGKKTAEQVTFRFGKDALTAVQLMEVDPPLPPEAWRESEKAVTINIGKVPAGEVHLLRFTLRPLKTGRFPLRLVVYAKNAQAPRILKSYIYIER
jgi:hypothetical protein